MRVLRDKLLAHHGMMTIDTIFKGVYLCHIIFVNVLLIVHDSSLCVTANFLFLNEITKKVRMYLLLILDFWRIKLVLTLCMDSINS